MKLEAEYKYEKVMRWYETQLRLGLISPHSQVPSVRDISSFFNLSISSVQRAMREMRRRGVIYSNGRKRFYFADTVFDCDKTVYQQANLDNRTARFLLLSQKSERAAFNYAFLGRSLDAGIFLQKCMRSIGSFDPQKFSIKAPATGLIELRRRLVGLMFDRGVNCCPDDIVVTLGDDIALESVLDAVCNANDKVLVEQPTHYGVLEAANRLGLVIDAIETDLETGINLEKLEQAMQDKAAKLLYLTPNIQIPLGYVMPMSKRQKIVQLAERYGIVIVEDDVFADLMSGANRLPTLATLAKSGNVIYLGSFNRTVASSISIGWCSSKEHAAAITAKLVERSYSVSMLNQQLLTEFLRKDYHKTHCLTLQQKLARNDQIFGEIVATHFPKDTQIICGNHGLSRLLMLPFNLTQADFELFEAQNIPVCDIGAFYHGIYPNNLLRICLCEAIDTSIKKYFQTLGQTLMELEASRRSAI